MFQLFKKKTREDLIKEEFDKFQATFSNIQKTILIKCFFDISYSDSNIDKEELNLILGVFHVFKLTYSEEFMDKILEYNDEFVLNTLRTLNDDQLNYFILTSIALIERDGVVKEEEINEVNKYYIPLGISNNRIRKVLDAFNSSL